TAHQEEHSNFSAKAHDYQEGVKADLPEDYIVAENSCRINDTDGGLTQACMDLTGPSWAKVESLVKGQTDEGNQFGLPGYTSVSELFSGKIKRAVKDRIKNYQQNYDEIQKLWEINLQAKTALEPFLSVDNQKLGAKIRKSYNNLNKNIDLLSGKLIDCEDGYCIPDDVQEAKDGIQKIDPMIVSLAMLSKVHGIVDTSSITKNAQLTELKGFNFGFQQGGEIIRVYDQDLDHSYDQTQLVTYNPINTTTLQPMNGDSKGRYIFLVEMDQLNNFADILKDSSIDSKHVYFPIILNAEKLKDQPGNIRLSVSNILEPIYQSAGQETTAEFITPKLKASLEGTNTTGTSNHLTISANTLPIKSYDGDKFILTTDHPYESTSQNMIKLNSDGSLILTGSNGKVLYHTEAEPNIKMLKFQRDCNLVFYSNTDGQPRHAIKWSGTYNHAKPGHCSIELGNDDLKILNKDTSEVLWTMSSGKWDRN
ncbi:hypothetical protein OAO18_03350, partial [Francisellaceae bacterium]|nr:hypothetical protein [Francisellaceae bacterium]